VSWLAVTAPSPSCLSMCGFEAGRPGYRLRRARSPRHPMGPALAFRSSFRNGQLHDLLLGQTGLRGERDLAGLQGPMKVA